MYANAKVYEGRQFSVKQLNPPMWQPSRMYFMQGQAIFGGCAQRNVVAGHCNRLPHENLRKIYREKYENSLLGTNK